MWKYPCVPDAASSEYINVCERFKLLVEHWLVHVNISLPPPHCGRPVCREHREREGEESWIIRYRYYVKSFLAPCHVCGPHHLNSLPLPSPPSLSPQETCDSQLPPEYKVRATALQYAHILNRCYSEYSSIVETNEWRHTFVYGLCIRTASQTGSLLFGMTDCLLLSF